MDTFSPVPLPMDGSLSWLPPSLVTTTLKSPSLVLLLFQSLFSGSWGSSDNIFTSYCTTLWVTTLIPSATTLSVLTLPPSLYLLGKLLPCALGPCIQSSKPFCSEMNPSCSLPNPFPHAVPCLSEEIHHPPTSQRSGHCPCCLPVPTPWS